MAPGSPAEPRPFLRSTRGCRSRIIRAGNQPRGKPMNEISSLAIVQEIMAHLAAGRLQQWSAMMDDAAVIETPFAPPWLPRRFEGRAAWDVTMRRWFGELFDRFEWIDLDLQAAADPAVVFGTGKSRGFAKDGRVYENEYCWIFQVRNGKMTGYREFFNALKVLETFGDEEGSRRIGRQPWAARRTIDEYRFRKGKHG
jgi:uncharacterized protein